jgi:hypothetical protein
MKSMYSTIVARDGLTILARAMYHAAWVDAGYSVGSRFHLVSASIRKRTWRLG